MKFWRLKFSKKKQISALAILNNIQINKTKALSYDNSYGFKNYTPYFFYEFLASLAEIFQKFSMVVRKFKGTKI